jgi:amidohydrolase
VSLRLVPDQKLKAVERQFAAAVRRLAPPYADVKVTFLHGADPAEVALDHPVFQTMDRAFKEVVGRGTVPARAGGTIPVVPALAQRGAPVVLTGIGLPDDGLHAPNEKLNVQQLWDGIEVFKRFFQLMAEEARR